MRLVLSRCTVRPWVAADLDSLETHANNRNVSRRLRDRFPFPYQRENDLGFLGWIIAQPAPTAWALEVGGQAVATFDLTRIFTLPFVENPASVRVLEKAGHTLEGRLRQCVIKDGHVHDQFLCAAYKPI